MMTGRHRKKSQIVFSDVTYRIFYTLYLLILFWILLLNLNVLNNLSQYILPISLLFFIATIICVYIFRKKLTYMGTVINGKILMLMFILLFVIISVIGLNLRVTPTWDYNAVHEAAFEWVREGQISDLSYFARYPNNNMILFVITIFYRITKFVFPGITNIGFIKASIILNSLLITSSIFFIGMSAKKIYGASSFYLSIFFTLFFTPIILYSEILYTDTLGLFLISLIIYIIIEKMNCFKIIHLVIIGFLFALGYQIKAFVIIILVGLSIIILLQKNLVLIRKLLFILLLSFSFIVTSVIVSDKLDESIGITENLYDQHQFPLSHWIMMSLNPKADGGFNDEDYQFTKSIIGKKQKENDINQKIEKRINYFGVKGLIRHIFLKKLTRTWTNGAMASDDYANRKNIYNGLLQRYFTNSGDKHYIYVIYSQLTHTILIIMIIVTGIRMFFYRNDTINLLNVSIFGLILFLMIWECNSRYIYSYIPLFVLTSLQCFFPLIKNEEYTQTRKQEKGSLI